MTDKEFVLSECYRMKEGECQCFDRWLMKSFVFGWPTIYENLHDAIMSCLPGSGWGEWTVVFHPTDFTVTICRHKAGNKLTYVDPDRRYLYKKIGDYYEPKEQP